MKCQTTLSRLVTSASIALLILSGCSTPVEIWQPPSGNQPGEPSSPANNAGAAPITDLSTRPKPLEESNSQIPEISQPSSSGNSSFTTRFEATESSLMQPGFLISGQGVGGDSPSVLITVDAKDAGKTLFQRRISLRIPEPLITRVRIETSSGSRTIQSWMDKGAKEQLSTTEKGEKGTTALQVRVKPVTLSQNVAGLVLDIGNTEKPGCRDFLLGLREVDANFIEVESNSDGRNLTQTLRSWIETHSKYRFRTASVSKSPIISDDSETWQAYASTRNIRASGGMTEESARALIPHLRLTIRPVGLSGDGVMTNEAAAGTTLGVRRCEPAAGTSDPVCRASTKDLLAASRVLAPSADTEFIEVTQGTAPKGFGNVMMKVGKRLITMDDGRVFFWNQIVSDVAAVSSSAPRYTHLVSINTTAGN